MGLEEKLIQTIERGEDFNTTEALLIASGINSPLEIEAYKNKLQTISNDFSAILRKRLSDGTVFDEIKDRQDEGLLSSDSEALMGYELQRYFFETKSERYNSRFLFNEVIDAQLSDSKEVGNCLGLVALYHTVGELIGVKTLPVFTRAHTYLQQSTDRGNRILIETTDSKGYNAEKEELGKVGTKIDLVSEMYQTRINESRDRNERNQLIDILIRINPNNPKPYASRAMDFFEDEDYENAGINFREALDRDKTNDSYFSGYAACLFKKGDIDSAKFYVKHALRLNSASEYAKGLLTEMEAVDQSPNQ